MGTPDGATAPDPPDARVLHRVRALLAKAESTTYAEEAEALTAKAQELMDRHAIDRAVLVAAGAVPGGGPGRRRLPVDPPYARPKLHLLSEVARANRCRAVWDEGSGDATVVGFPDDADRVELLFTSLLVQSTTAMLAAGATPEARSRSFRHSFLVAYAVRIGERLRDAARATAAEADRASGGAVLPVLADRAERVDVALAEAFPTLRRTRVTARDGAGYRAGHRAADRARLRHDDQVDGGAGTGRHLGRGRGRRRS